MESCRAGRELSQARVSTSVNNPDPNVLLGRQNPSRQFPQPRSQVQPGTREAKYEVPIGLSAQKRDPNNLLSQTQQRSETSQLTNLEVSLSPSRAHGSMAKLTRLPSTQPHALPPQILDKDQNKTRQKLAVRLRRPVAQADNPVSGREGSDPSRITSHASSDRTSESPAKRRNDDARKNITSQGALARFINLKSETEELGFKRLDKNPKPKIE